MSASIHCLKCGSHGQNHFQATIVESATLAELRMDELLKSNHPPLQAERVHLESVISEDHILLAGLKERISQHRNALEVLLDQEKRVEQKMESCKTIVHPIRRIPDDIVREIFLTSFRMDTRDGKDMLDKTFAPLILSQVCRDWRVTALSTSQLWSSIKLDFDLYQDEIACQYLLQMYLQRSANHDVVISLHCKRDISRNNLIPVLLLNAPRWTTSVSLSIPYRSLHAFSATRGTLHRLDRLSVTFIGDVPVLPQPNFFAELTKPIFDAFEYAPLLCGFSLRGANKGTRRMSLPCSQLTDYAGNDFTGGYIDILNRAPNMEIASMQCDLDPELGIFLPSSHRRLHTLHVYEVEGSVDSPGGIINVLSHFEFPALKSLRMAYAHTFIRVPTSLIGSTAGGLKSLSFDTPFAISSEAQADLISLLKTTTSLDPLWVSCRFVYGGNPQNEGLLLGLNANINPDVVPRLTSLVFRFINVVPYLSPAFVDMVQSRRPGASKGAALQTLRLSVPLSIPVGLNPGVAARWRDLCDEGFITYGVQ
ncbi:hypothetical protein EDD85DRAFT_355693 [Armillaria nabsnona]|nr:hypothetical protein EDD85DRAFT_355693 [Armillaria nabsnona]